MLTPDLQRAIIEAIDADDRNPQRYDMTGFEDWLRDHYRLARSTTRSYASSVRSALRRLPDGWPVGEETMVAVWDTFSNEDVSTQSRLHGAWRYYAEYAASKGVSIAYPKPKSKRRGGLQ